MTSTPSMAGPSKALLQFVEDERLRAPMFFDQLAESTADRIRKQMPTLSPLARSSAADILQALKARNAKLCALFTESLHDQVDAELRRHQHPANADRPPSSGQASKPGGPGGLSAAALSLVDEEEVAVDVELAHAIDLIKSVAEFELRELQTYTAALVGDMDVTRDHNPYRAETYARALWAAAQGVPLSRGCQVQFMRAASGPLAELLRLAYAAASSRLDMQGVVPAAYRTVILPAGARRGRAFDGSYSPDLQQVREALALVEPALQVAQAGATFSKPSRSASPQLPPAQGSAAQAADAHPTAGASTARPAGPPKALPPLPPPRVDARAEALVARLFDAIRTDTRVPADVLLLILRLVDPALRLASVDGEHLADERHPLWCFINDLAFESEMMPDSADPERRRWLRLAQATIEQLSAEPSPSRALYVWACEKLAATRSQRLARRCTQAASQIGALQKLEDRLLAGQAAPSTFHGALDVPQLDTVPAGLLPDSADVQAEATERWLAGLQPGVWLRLFLQGHWVQAQLLWPGERREIWLLGDGASDATWAIRRRALATLHQAGLFKSLQQRSLVRRAAGQVHAQAHAHRLANPQPQAPAQASARAA